jgi:hypothetical protein
MVNTTLCLFLNKETAISNLDTKLEVTSRKTTEPQKEFL